MRAKPWRNADDASLSTTSCANSESDLHYRIELTPAAQRDLRKLDPHVRGKVATNLLRLEENPRPVGSERLHAKEKLYRIYLGPGKNYRIYQIADEVLRVLVVRIGDRKEVYRGIE